MAKKYKQPRKINVISAGLFLVLAVVLYSGWKYGPPYYRAKKVDGVLDEIKRDAGRFMPGTGDPREQAIMKQLRREVVDTGVDERTLKLYFADGGNSLHVEFTETIKHVVGGELDWHFHRQQKIVPVGR